MGGYGISHAAAGRINTSVPAAEEDMGVGQTESSCSSTVPPAGVWDIVYTHALYERYTPFFSIYY
jgi:hypothetical protein